MSRNNLGMVPLVYLAVIAGLFAWISSGQIKQQTFQRFFDFNTTANPDIIIIDGTATSSSHCVWVCSVDDRCLSCVYHQGRCITLSWYLHVHVSTQSVFQTKMFYFGRQVIRNVALNKPVSQSSDYIMHHVEDAVDGLALNEAGQCMSQSHTAAGDKAPWFQIDLLKTYKILQIRFLGKTQIFVDRLHDVNIIAGDTPNTLNSTCAYYVGPPSMGEWVEITCSPQTEGRFVKLDKMYSEDRYHLELCELEITVMI